MKKQKSLGQNFLVDSTVAQEILERAEIVPGGRVLEIGPGKGALTESLLDIAGEVMALEIDPRLCRGLEKKFSSRPGFHLVEGNALKYDFASIGQGFQVVSNLPYYAATHILKRLIHYGKHIHNMTLMLQKEVVNRLTAQPGQKEYGSLSVFIQYQCDVEKVLDVHKSCFDPVPKVNSAVIKVTPLARPKVQVECEKVFYKVVNAAFLHKRKMLKNNLGLWRKQFHTSHDKIKLAGIDMARRGETLSLEEFATIANHIHSQNG